MHKYLKLLYDVDMKDLKFHRLNGRQARSYIDEVAQLRLRVFFDFPYLYEGSLEYEKKYLETYFKAEHSFILLVEHQGNIIGATTSIWAQEEEENFKGPFTQAGIDPATVFYFGESVLLNEYRGHGIGKLFFEEREKFARSLGFIKYLAFCAVIRNKDHPLMPQEYKPLDGFWNAQGFSKKSGLTTSYEWKDRDQALPTFKKMQFWIKNI
jgi:GNAT superfamily N-acetyltransferase